MRRYIARFVLQVPFQRCPGLVEVFFGFIYFNKKIYLVGGKDFVGCFFGGGLFGEYPRKNIHHDN